MSEKRQQYEDLIDAAKEYTERLFAGNADGHGLDHSMRVYGYAMLIAETEPTADRFIVAMLTHRCT